MFDCVRNGPFCFGRICGARSLVVIWASRSWRSSKECFAIWSLLFDGLRVLAEPGFFVPRLVERNPSLIWLVLVRVLFQNNRVFSPIITQIYCHPIVGQKLYQLRFEAETPLFHLGFSTTIANRIDPVVNDLIMFRIDPAFIQFLYVSVV